MNPQYTTQEALALLARNLSALGLGSEQLEQHLASYIKRYGLPKGPKNQTTLWSAHQIKHLEQALKLSHQQNLDFAQALEQTQPQDDWKDALKALAQAQQHEIEQIRQDLSQRLEAFIQEANPKIERIEQGFSAMHQTVLALERYLKQLQ